jgi:glycine cleavage system H protein
MNIPENLLYSETHEWALIDGDTATVGITDHAQNELSDVVFVELPKVGVQVKKSEAIAVVESVKAASDIYSPLAGEVIAINEAATADPAIVNREPFTGGWLFRLKLTDPSEASQLQSPSAYAAQIG